MDNFRAVNPIHYSFSSSSAKRLLLDFPKEMRCCTLAQVKFSRILRELRALDSLVVRCQSLVVEPKKVVPRRYSLPTTKLQTSLLKQGLPHPILLPVSHLARARKV